jgi:hypothetical protein
VEAQKKEVDLGVDFLFLSNLNNKIKIVEAGICLQTPIHTAYGYCSDHFGMYLTIHYA